MSIKISPITLKGVQTNSAQEPVTYTTYRHEEDGFADLNLIESLQRSIRVGESYPDCSLQDTMSAWWLIRSYLWRVKHRDAKPILITTDEVQEQVEDQLAREDAQCRGLLPISFEQVIREARTLTLVDKAMQTLDNLYPIYATNAGALTLPYAVPILDGHQYAFIPNPSHPEDGMTYGCDNITAAFVYAYLDERKFVCRHDPLTTSPRHRFTAKAYDALDKMRKGTTTLSRRGFLVRRFDADLDEWLNPVMAAVSKRLNCPIEAVWQREHNDRIDERIFRQIREASVVVVNVSPDRYNVGLEHGYAMALGKPIVVIREKPDPWVAPPFDISTQNCWDYERTEDGANKLVEKLVARVEIALDVRGLA